MIGGWLDCSGHGGGCGMFGGTGKVSFWYDFWWWLNGRLYYRGKKCENQL